MPANLEQSLDLLRHHQIPVREQKIKELFYETDFSARKRKVGIAKASLHRWFCPGARQNSNDERQSREKKWRDLLVLVRLIVECVYIKKVFLFIQKHISELVWMKINCFVYC